MSIRVTKRDASAITKRLRALLTERFGWSGTHQTAFVLTAGLLGWRNQETFAASMLPEPGAVQTTAPETPTAVPQRTTQSSGWSGTADLGSPTDHVAAAILAGYREAHRLLVERTAEEIVATAADIASGTDFQTAIHEDGDEDIHALILVEDELAERLQKHPELIDAVRRLSPNWGEKERDHDTSRAAKAVVDDALDMAEQIWTDRGLDEAEGESEEEDGDGAAAITHIRTPTGVIATVHENGRITGRILIPAGDIGAGGVEGYNDLLSKKLVGNDLLMGIDHEVIEIRGGVAVIEVSGDPSDAFECDGIRIEDLATDEGAGDTLG